MSDWVTVMGLRSKNFFSYSADDNKWNQEPDFESYSISDDDNIQHTLTTTEARVAGTEFSIILPLVGADENGNDNENNSTLRGSIGFVLSGDGDDHGPMREGEFHAFYPSPFDNEITWRQLPSHPGPSRWAPGSFVIRGTARAYFTSGYDRTTGLLHSDVWMIDLSSLFTEQQQQQQQEKEQEKEQEQENEPEKEQEKEQEEADIDTTANNNNEYLLVV